MNIFYILSTIWVVIAIGTFIYLFFESAPYGRHIKKGWGLNIPTRVGWIVMESPCVILMIAYGLIVRDQLQTVHDVLVDELRWHCFETLLNCSLLVERLLGSQAAQFVLFEPPLDPRENCLDWLEVGAVRYI